MTVLMSRPGFARAWRHVELAISRIIRGWPPVLRHDGPYPNYGMHLAPCDSLLIGSGPWLCLCCLRLRRRIAGVSPRQGSETVATQHGTYIWDAPDPLEESLRVALARMGGE